MVLTQAILAGILIGIGDIALMEIGKPLGAFIFSLALLSIINLKIPLYTGIIGKAPKTKNWIQCVCVLILNSVGTAATIWFWLLYNPKQVAIIRNIADVKFSKGLLPLFVAGVLCNILIHVAVTTKNVYIVILGIVCFIMCGFEHSIADAGYVFVAFTWARFFKWIAIVVGNTCGGILTEFLINFSVKTKYSDDNKVNEAINHLEDVVYDQI